MVFFCRSLAALGKKAFGNIAKQANAKDIISRLPLDVSVTGMDACVLKPEDFGGFVGRELVNAVKNRNEEVKVLFFCRNDKELKKFEWVKSCAVTVIIEPKITPQILEEHVNRALKGMDISERDVQVVSKDMLEASRDPAKEPEPEAPPAPVPAVQPPAAEEKAITTPSAPLPTEFPEEAETEEEPKALSTGTFEERIQQCDTVPDWELFSKSLKTESAMRELLQTNSEYSGVVNMLEVLDREIFRVWSDPELSSEQKMDRIKEIGLDRAAYKDKQNSILVGKLSSIMTTIVSVTTTAMERRLSTIRKGLDEVATFKTYFKDMSRVEALTQDRLDLNLELTKSLDQILKIYGAMDQTAAEVISEMVDGLPSENPYINSLYTSMRNMFVPKNARTLAEGLMQSLQQNRVALSALKDEISGFISLMFQLYDADYELITAQRDLIERLKAQRVEDVIVMQSVIKSALKIFIGGNDTGTTATALTLSGINSRRANTLLIDLRPENRFNIYGQDYISIEEFRSTRPEQPFLCVHGNFDSDFEELEEFIQELSTLVGYYSHINIILNDSQTPILNRLAENALTIHFIADSTDRGIAIAKNIFGAYKDKGNTAKKLCLIDCPVDGLALMNEIGIDPMNVKAVMIPYIQELRASSLKHVRPYDYADICTVFEEAFR